MKRLPKNKLIQILKQYLPIVAIVAFAILLRLYLLPERTSFDADQEELAFKAKEILSGDPVLLGQKTSLGGFSIGPGFSYIWAFFSFFLKGNPIAGTYASVSLGLLFIVGIYIVGRKIFSEKVGLTLSLIVAFSSCLIAWDQSPWAPSLFYVSELIIFYGIYISRKNYAGLPLTALGLLLAFQSHFAVFLLVIPIAIYLFIYKPVVNTKVLIFTILILLVGIIPLLIYDLIHNFVNFGRLVSVFSLGISGEAPSRLKLIYTLVQNSINIIAISMPIVLRYVIFIFLITIAFFGVVKDKKRRRLVILSFIFLFVPLFEFMFYRSGFSEYYLMTAVVPFLFILGYIFNKIKSRALIVLILVIFLIPNLIAFCNFQKPVNLGAKEKIIQKILEMKGFSGYGVSLSTEPGYNFGYSYLFDYYKATPDIPPKSGEEKIFTILVPPGYKGIEPIYQVGGVGLRWEGI